MHAHDIVEVVFRERPHQLILHRTHRVRSGMQGTTLTAKTPKLLLPRSETVHQGTVLYGSRSVMAAEGASGHHLYTSAVQVQRQLQACANAQDKVGHQAKADLDPIPLNPCRRAALSEAANAA